MVKGLGHYIKNYQNILFYVSIFLFRIPSFYVVPFFRNVFLTSQSISRVVFMLLFLLNLCKIGNLLQREIKKKNSRIIYILLLTFFILSSFSVFSAVDINAFLNRYKDLVIGYISFHLFFYFKEHVVRIFKVMVSASIINIIYQFFLVTNFPLFTTSLDKIIYEKHLSFVLSNASRGRILIDVYDEIFLPFIFLFGRGQQATKKLLSFVLISFIGFFSFVSNFRTRVVMIVFGVLSSIRLLNSKKQVLLYIFIIGIIAYVANIFSFDIYNFSFYDRFLLANNPSAVDTLESRLTQIKLSLDMGRQTILGVGLGNYYDNLPSVYRQDLIPASPVLQGGREYVHNIFGSVIAESGYITFFVFLLLIFFFFRTDMAVFKEGNIYKKATVYSFWILFIYSLFNPNVPVTYQVLFWGLRGLLFS